LKNKLPAGFRMSAVEVSDLKRKLRLIKNKLLDPTERNLQQAISMIDDTFATEEVQMSCSRFGITCTPPPIFAVPGYPFVFPESPIDSNPKKSEAPTMTDAYAQTKTLEVLTTSTQTTDTGECCAFGKSALYDTTQANIEKAIELLTEAKSSLSDRGKKRKSDGSLKYSLRSKALPQISTSLCNTVQNSRSSPSTPIGRSNVTHLQRVQQLSERTPMANNMLMTTEKLAVEDGFMSSPEKDNKSDSASGSKRQEGDKFTCDYCCFRGESEHEMFYHECLLLPQMTSPFLCCGTAYKHRGRYVRHRDTVIFTIYISIG
ncbi:hypothetical protein PMAYCL1PPCAC_07383, partial [Pristionchus mayeri]